MHHERNVPIHVILSSLNELNFPILVNHRRPSHKATLPVRVSLAFDQLLPDDVYRLQLLSNTFFPRPCACRSVTCSNLRMTPLLSIIYACTINTCLSFELQGFEFTFKTAVKSFGLSRSHSSQSCAPPDLSTSSLDPSSRTQGKWMMVPRFSMRLFTQSLTILNRFCAACDTMGKTMK